MLNFRLWLESTEIRHPRNVARRWKGKMPVEGGQNKKAISEFVGTMTIEDMNQDLVNIVMHRRAVNEPRYDEPIDGNLIYANTGKLGHAWGTIAWPEPAHFSFYLQGELQGNLEIKHPPVVYTKEDEQLLEGIIWHELRHALDFAEGSVHYTETPGKVMRFSMEKYAKHILEARAYSDQLRYLLTKTSPEEVLRLLSSASFFRLDDRLLATAKAFLEMKNESWLAPAITAASLMLPHPQPVLPERPATNQVSESPASGAVQVLTKLVQLFLFRNFLS